MCEYFKIVILAYNYILLNCTGLNSHHDPGSKKVDTKIQVLVDFSLTSQSHTCSDFHVFFQRDKKYWERNNSVVIFLAYQSPSDSETEATDSSDLLFFCAIYSA